MAKVATAYVEVKPDLGNFREELKAKLKAMNATAKVKIDAEGIDVVSSAVEKVAKNNKKAAAESGDAWKASFAGLDDATGKLGRDQITILDRNLKAQKAYQKQLVDTQKASGKAQLDELDKSIKAQVSLEKQRQDAINALHVQAFAIDKKLDDDRKARVKKQLDEIEKTAKAGVAREKQRQAAFDAMHTEAIRNDVERERIKERIINALHAEALTVNRTIDEKAARERDIRTRHQVQDEVDVIRRTFRNNPFVPDSMWRQMELDFERRFGRMGSTAIRSLQREVSKHRVRIQADVDDRGVAASIARMTRNLARSFPRGGFTSVIRTALDAAAGLIDIVGKVLPKAFSLFRTSAQEAGDATLDMFNQVSGAAGGVAGKGGLGSILSSAGGVASVGTEIATVGGTATEAAGPIGAVVSGIAALGLAAVGTGLAVGILQAILGTLLAIIIPLVAGITSLVAEVGALAGVLGGSFGLLPGLLAGAAAAFGPLLLVADKFSKLMENTTTHTGELFVVVERLRNAIFAVISRGLVEGITNFTTKVLPKLFYGIEQVSLAWNRLFKAILKLASAKSTVNAFNQILLFGAWLVDRMRDTLITIGPALATLATAAIPALKDLFTVIGGIVGYFADWVRDIKKTGELDNFMKRLSFTLAQILSIARPLMSLLGGFFSTVLGPVGELFIDLRQILFVWSKWMNNTKNQKLVIDFLREMNRIFISLVRFVPSVAAAVVAIGPALRKMNDAALPALKGLLNLFVRLVNDLAPAVIRFLKGFTKILDNPSTQRAIDAMASGISDLMDAVIKDPDAIPFLFRSIGALAKTAAFLLKYVLLPLFDLMISDLRLLKRGFESVGAISVVQYHLVGDALEWLRTKVLGVIKVIGLLPAAATFVASSFTKNFKTGIAGAFTALEQFTASIQRKFGTATTTVFEAILAKLRQFAGPITTVRGFFDTLRTAIDRAITRVRDLLTALSSVPGPVGGMARAVLAAFKAISDAIGRVSAALKTIGAAIGVAFSLITNNVTNAKNRILDFIGVLKVVAAGLSGVNFAAWALSSALGRDIPAANAAAASSFGWIPSGVEAMGNAAKAAAALSGALSMAGKTGAAAGAAAAAAAANVGAIAALFANIGRTVVGVVSTFFKNAYNAPVDTKLDAGAGGSKAGKNAGIRTAAGFLSTLTPALSKLDWNTLVKGGKAYDSGREIAQYLAKGITSGSKNIEKVTNFLLKKMGGKKGPLQAILNQLTAYRKALIAGGHDEAYWTTQLAAIKDFKAKVVETLTAGRSLVGTFGFIPTPAEVANQLQAVYDQLLNFTTTLTDLQKRGLSKSLAAEWLQAGPEQAGNLVEGLRNATPEQLAAINTLYAKIGTTANTQAEQAAKNFYGVGQATVEGYIKAIRDGTSKIGAAIQKMLEAGVAAGKKYLGIKSPSTVFGAMGVDTMLGYIIGINDKAGAVAASISDVYGQMTAVPGPQLSTPTLAQQRFLPYAGIPTQAQPTATLVKVYLGDKEITDILRVQVDNYDTTRARALLAGRRGG